ncbi:YqhA family protein [Roseomonas sp. CAU 1739]|uniref:YqhA family protein n=1 Tax=Roseomonas sp. CAU 1739 TaxID=3140364 RepID=UPI00325A70D2
MERLIERIIVVSRWALVPFYLGLIVALFTLLAAFLRELWSAVSNAMAFSEHQAIVKVLSMVDLTLMAGLVVIVIFSGYENIVSRIDPGGARDWPAWLTTVDFGGLKKKLFASMAAISAVTMLKALMKLEETVSETQLYWLVVMNTVFLLGYLLMAIADWFAARTTKG